jgi:hypothetical protein
LDGRILVEMEDLINETWEDSAGRKSMSKVRQLKVKFLH